MSTPERTRTRRWLGQHREDLIALTQALVRRPSENRPPGGEEAACQQYVAEYLSDLGLEPDLFEPDSVVGITEHPAWWPGRDYAQRPCVSASLQGSGGGRSLVFSGHIDVVPAIGRGRYGFYDAEVVGGRLYGRGAWDMKGGIACYLHALRCLVECEVPLAGTVTVETTVDEEFGGANGTLACRLRRPGGDGAILPEPSGLAVCPATRGGIQFRLHATGGTPGMSFGTEPPPNALIGLAGIATALAKHEAERGLPLIQMLLRAGEELEWGTAEGTPDGGVLEFWAEILPGTSEAELRAELRKAVARAAVPGIQIEWEQRTRFLPATAIDERSPIVTAMVGALGELGHCASVETAPFACDAFLFNECSTTPVVVCGPRGANAHAPDEYVLTSDLHLLANAYVGLALGWCA